jgi:AcrR family transcriptional regulator
MASDLSVASRRRRGRPGKSRDDVVAAAFRVLAKDDVGGFTLDAVAREAGMSRPALLHHFRSKDALVGAVAGRIARAEVENNLAHIERTDTAEAALLALLDALVGFHRRDFVMFRAHYILPQLLGMDDESLRREVYPVATALFDAIDLRILREQRAGTLDDSFEPRRLSVFVWTLAIGVSFRGSLLATTGSKASTALDALLDEARRAIKDTLAARRPQKNVRTKRPARP